eukprot:15453763-Alexandrium_andersonii.AAC.1
MATTRSAPGGRQAKTSTTVGPQLGDELDRKSPIAKELLLTSDLLYSSGARARRGQWSCRPW